MSCLPPPSCRPRFKDDILSAPCGCRLAAPIICHSRLYAPASFPHRCTSPLRSFSFLCSWRCPALLPVRLCTAPSSGCFGALRFPSEDNFPFSILIFHEITLATQSNSASALELQLEQPPVFAHSICPTPLFFACSELFQHLGTHHLFHRITRQPEVQAVGVNLLNWKSRLSRNLSRQS